MAQFSYKLDTIEQMEDKEVRRGDDEQLLDDLQRFVVAVQPSLLHSAIQTHSQKLKL